MKCMVFESSYPTANSLKIEEKRLINFVFDLNHTSNRCKIRERD